MKRTFLIAVHAALLASLATCSLTAEQQALIQPIIPKSLRLPGETKQDLFARIFERQTKADPHEKRKAAFKHMAAHTAALLEKQETKKSYKCQCCKKKSCKNFENFKGYWLLDSIDDWSSITLIEFFEDEHCNPMAKFYDGTQQFIREQNQNDADFELVLPSTVGAIVPVEVLGPRSIRFRNHALNLSNDDLTSTFRIQDSDDNLSYMVLWSAWDGAGDSPKYGINETLTQYRRLPVRPDIQLNRLPSKIDWTNPVEMLKYIASYYALLGQPEKAVSLHQIDYIGWANYEQLLQTMLTTGVIRTARVSTEYRGGGYIGVWRTQFPEDFPITTIHTQELPHMNVCSTIHISGFDGAYAELNGTHIAAAFPPATISQSTPYPWQECSSREHFVHILYDSSHIQEAYDPNIHGVATLTAQHGPVTPDMGYREFMAAVIDFVVSSFGSGTHTRLAIWRDTLITVPETFEQLEEAVAQDAVGFTQVRTRTFGDNGFQLYWNPYILGSGFGAPAFNLNDPFGLGAIEFDPYFDYDIALQNYLEEGTVKNIFFTVTGPTDPCQSITSLLTDIGYTSNGSRVVFKASDYQTFPEPLVDKYGTHEWMQYNWVPATNSTGPDDYASQAFFGGIIKKELTGKKTVAYIRIKDESSFDEPYEVLLTRSLAFPQKGISSTYLGNMIAAWAALIKELNKHKPDRFIIDIRNNNGGFVINDAFGALFGGDRPSGDPALGFPGNGERDPLIINGSGIQTVFDSVPKTPGIIPANEAAAAFPKGVVRGCKGKKKEVIILTSTRSASSGDIFPHKFLGPDPKGTVQDLGEGVELRIMGDIDGRLWSGIKGFDPLPIDPLSQNLVDSTGVPRTATYLVSDSGLLDNDRHGSIVNPTLATRPNPLLQGWYDQTEWQDIGVTQNLVPYPLGDCKPQPVYEDRSTWRDTWLENAIKN